MSNSEQIDVLHLCRGLRRYEAGNVGALPRSRLQLFPPVRFKTQALG